jgi:hypothetical protein
MKLNLKNIFTRKQKCDVCGEKKKVTYECEDCYYSGYDIDKQIKRLQKIKKDSQNTGGKNNAKN